MANMGYSVSPMEIIGHNKSAKAILRATAQSKEYPGARKWITAWGLYPEIVNGNEWTGEYFMPAGIQDDGRVLEVDTKPTTSKGTLRKQMARMIALEGCWKELVTSP